MNEEQSIAWISVKDRLPEKDTPVIVYIADRGSMMTTHYYTDFCLIRTGVPDEFSDHGVTHWAELIPPVL